MIKDEIKQKVEVINEINVVYQSKYKTISDILKEFPESIDRKMKNELKNVSEKILEEIIELEKNGVIKTKHHLQLTIDYLVKKHIHNSLFEKFLSISKSLDYQILLDNHYNIEDIIKYVCDCNITDTISLSDVIKQLDDKVMKR